MLTKFLDPKNDLVFKRIFGTEKNKDILIPFLNDILNHRYIGEIKDVTFASSVQAPEIIAQKQSIVDVLCRDQNGMQYIVEMQVAETAGFPQRSQFYASRAYGGQLFVGEDYQQLQGVVFLAITDFVMFPNKSALKSEHGTLDLETHEHDLKDILYTFIELPKFTKKLEELTSIREKWYYYLKYAPETTPEVYKQLVENLPALRRAYQELEAFSWSAEDLAIYEQIKKRDRDSASLLLAQFQKGEEKGREEGREEGIQTRSLEIARNMLHQLGLDIETVQQATGVSKEELVGL